MSTYADYDALPCLNTGSKYFSNPITLKKASHLKLLSLIAGLKCPRCRTTLNIRQMNRIAPYTHCPKCSSKVCLGDGYAMKMVKFFTVFAPAFLLCSIVGFSVIGSVPALNFYLESKGSTEPNLVGFLILIVCFVLPTLLFCMRIFRVEIVEPHDEDRTRDPKSGH